MLVVCGNVDNGWACAQVDGELEVVSVVNLNFDVIFLPLPLRANMMADFPAFMLTLKAKVVKWRWITEKMILAARMMVVLSRTMNPIERSSA